MTAWVIDLTIRNEFTKKKSRKLCQIPSSRGVQKTHQPAKPDPTQLDPSGWVGF